MKTRIPALLTALLLISALAIPTFATETTPETTPPETITQVIEVVETIDYTDILRLLRFTNERGKILPRRMSGNCAKHQRQLSEAIKRARAIALMPYTVD